MVAGTERVIYGMQFKLRDATERAAVIAYLTSLSE